MRSNNNNAPSITGSIEVYQDHPFFSDNVYQWVARTDLGSILNTLINADYKTLQSVRRMLGDCVSDLQSEGFINLIAEGGIKTLDQDKWLIAVLAFRQLSGSRDERNSFLAQVLRAAQNPSEHNRVEAREELPAEADNKQQDNVQKQVNAKSDNATTITTEGKPDPKSSVPHTGQAANARQGHRYVSYENSAFKPKAAPKISWWQWFGHKTVWLLKTVFAISNSLAIRRAVLSGLARTALQIWAAQIVALSAAIAAGMMIWKALNWAQERIAPAKNGASRVGEQVKATIFGVDKVNKDLYIRMHGTQKSVRLSYAVGDQKQTKKDAFAEQLEKRFAESKHPIPDAEQEQVKLFIDKQTNLYSLAF